MHLYWSEQSANDLPENNLWLSAGEIDRLHSLRFAKRRADWRLGRWTAKRAIAACLNWPAYPQILARIEIRATPSGAPEAVIASLETPVVISLSHRDGRALCAVSLSEIMLGCDLEVIEPHSAAFVADYLTPEEQFLVARTSSSERAEMVTLLWSAKESALKALRQGLRLDTRSVIVSPVAGAPDLDGWSPLRVGCVDGRVFQGWWRTADGVLRTVVANPAPDCPICVTPLKGAWNPENVFDLAARIPVKLQAVSMAPP
jgi:4'-phosphopantetheinyl transferase